MHCWHRIKADRVTIPVDEKWRYWTVAWGGPVAVTPDAIEQLMSHATQIDPDGHLLTIMPRFFDQISWVLRLHPRMGQGLPNEAELVSFELATAGERGEVFLGIHVFEGALSLFAPTDLEDLT